LKHEPAAIPEPELAMPTTSEPAGVEAELPAPAVEPSIEGEVTSDQAELEPVLEPKSIQEPEPAQAEPSEPYRVGEWSGRPNYGCPWCSYKTIEGSGAVELHILATLDRGDTRHLPALEKQTGGS
jgi:hypothetical protein